MDAYSRGRLLDVPVSRVGSYLEGALVGGALNRIIMVFKSYRGVLNFNKLLNNIVKR